jgi:hypothetical protein
MKIAITITVFAILAGLIPSVFAQEYNGKLTLDVYGAIPSQDYITCGGVLEELHIGCTEDKGSTYVDYVLEFYFIPNNNNKLYGCVIDQTTGKSWCNSAQTSDSEYTMNIDVSKPSEIPLPIKISDIQIEGETTTETVTWTNPETGLV